MNRFVKMGAMVLAMAAAVPAFAADAEEEGAVGWTPLAVGLASPVQLPWGHARWDVFGLDVNVLYSGAPKMYGLGVGGLGMYTSDDVAGIVASGLCNWGDKNVYGLRATIGANICQGEVYGMEAGLFGYRKEFWGLDVEFLGSIQEEVNGIQAAFLANVSRVKSYGWTIAAIGNLATTAYGCQTAILFNATEELHGAQISLINYAQECPWGFQIGLINIIMDNSLKVLPFVNGYF
jgi:hypothetical protein